MRTPGKFCILAFLAAAVLSFPQAAAAEGNEPGKKSEAEAEKEKNAALEARIKELEKKVQELEETHQEPAPPPPSAQPFFPHFEQPGRFGNVDELWDRFRRELESEMQVPNGLPNFAPGFGRRPRLGVELAPPSEDLAEEYKNDVKEGAFILKVVPGSPAARKGLKVGDAIISIGGKTIKSPQDAIAAVREAPAGEIEILVLRHGAKVSVKVDLSAPENELSGPAEELSPDPFGQEPAGKWLRRDQKKTDEPAGNTRAITEIKAGALEMSSQLADELKLNDEQKKKMSEVLEKEAKALGEEAAKPAETHRNANGWNLNLNMTGDLNKLVEKHVRNAEKELDDVLTAEQMKKWSAYRKDHNSVSFSQSMTFENTGDSTSSKESTGF
jgi:membrane-associated protease RseP (regulator of RpoE activity)